MTGFRNGTALHFSEHRIYAYHTCIVYVWCNYALLVSMDDLTLFASHQLAPNVSWMLIGTFQKCAPCNKQIICFYGARDSSSRVSMRVHFDCSRRRPLPKAVTTCTSRKFVGTVPADSAEIPSHDTYVALNCPWAWALRW